MKKEKTAVWRLVWVYHGKLKTKLIAGNQNLMMLVSYLKQDGVENDNIDWFFHSYE